MAATDEAKKATRTTARPYVVFAFDGHGYKRLGEETAASADQAKAKFFATLDGDSAMLMAIPERYVKLTHHEKEMQPVLKSRPVREDELRVGGVAEE